MSELDERISSRLEWIAQLEAELADMCNDWPVDVKDGARVCAAVLFPDWSPALDKLRTIFELNKFIYPALSEEVLSSRRAVEEARERVAKNGTEVVESFSEERFCVAMNSFATVARRAGLEL